MQTKKRMLIHTLYWMPCANMFFRDITQGKSESIKDVSFAVFQFNTPSAVLPRFDLAVKGDGEKGRKVQEVPKRSCGVFNSNCSYEKVFEEIEGGGMLDGRLLPAFFKLLDGMTCQENNMQRIL